MNRTTTTLVVAVVGAVSLWAAAHLATQRHHDVDAGRTEVSETRQQRAVPTFPMAVELTRQDGTTKTVELCQFDNGVLCGVDETGARPCTEPRWNASHPIPWEVFAQGEYVGPARIQHMPIYHLRVDDVLEVVYWFTHEARDESYRLQVGDEVMIESFTDEAINRGNLAQGRGLMVQPDGTITLKLLGQVPAAGRTVEELRNTLDELYDQYYREPSITVTPLKTNARLEAFRSSVDARFGTGGQVRRVQITPGGTVQLPGLTSTQAHGLTLPELEREIKARYDAEFGPGVNITVALFQRAPRFVYVLGEVVNPGQFQLQGPTTVIQALALAGDYNVGANMRQVVVLRRTDEWKLIATRLDLRGVLLGHRPHPSDEIWLRDSDIVIVPKSPILLMDDLINLVFTRGVYGVIPFQGVAIGFSKASTI